MKFKVTRILAFVMTLMLLSLVVVYPVSNKTLRRWGNKVYFSKTDWRMEKCHAIIVSRILE